MLTSKIGGSKTLIKLLDLLSNPSEIKVLIENLVEQETKTKAALDELIKIETFDEYVKNRKMEINTDLEAHLARVKVFEIEKVKLDEEKTRLSESIDKLNHERELFKDECQLELHSIKQKSDLIELQDEKLRESQTLLESEIVQARETRSYYENKLKELEDSIARLKV